MKKTDQNFAFKDRLFTIYGDLLSTDEIHSLSSEITLICRNFKDNILKISRNSDKVTTESKAKSHWNQEDVILITYGDSIVQDNEPPLQTLNRFLDDFLLNTVNSIHLLPFFPFSSDDGFSVINYRLVNPELGNWTDVENLNTHFDLMMDLVINHCSREHLWFVDYINNREPYVRYFIEADPQEDLSLVTRPRNTPLLTPVHTHRGIRHVWATFSEDQIDLNFAATEVLIEFISILLLYIENGARFIRLDAVAFLWKEMGTRCLHHVKTHEIVKLLRDILDEYAPNVVLITETNVPVAENLSYFGDSDEAHMVYQFGLPPLVLQALNRGSSQYLTEWAQNIPVLPPGCSYLNFTASHDGIGVRPVEGILPKREIQDLIDCMHRFGGFVSMKANGDGTESPYEINITLFDACMGTRRGIDHFQIARFLCSQAMMMVLQGIPAVYIQSLLASANDLNHVEQTGRTRSINRRIWQDDELRYLLENPVSNQSEVFNALTHMIKVRRRQLAFHPNATQEVISVNTDLFVVRRQFRDISEDQVIFALSNVTDRILHLPLSILGFLKKDYVDILHNPSEQIGDIITLHPYQSLWLTNNPR